MKYHKKPFTNKRKLVDRGKKSKTMSEVKLVRNINTNPEDFLDRSLVQKKKNMHIAKESFGLKEDNPSQINCQNQFSHPSLSYIEQEFHKSLTKRKIHI